MMTLAFGSTSTGNRNVIPLKTFLFSLLTNKFALRSTQVVHTVKHETVL